MVDGNSLQTASPTLEPVSTPTLEPDPQTQPFDVPHPVGDIHYRLPLTIQYVDEVSATFHFELSQPASGILYLRPEIDDDEGIIQVPFSEGLMQQIRVEGLQADHMYEVMVLLGEEGTLPQFLDQAWGPLQICTARSEGPLRIGVIGDASFGDSVSVQLVQRLAEMELDFVIHVGDVVDVLEYGVDPYEAYAYGYYVPFEPLLMQMPVYSIPGNHDYDADILFEGVPFYFRAFPAFDGVMRPEGEPGEQIAAYAFSRGGVQFLFLDSQVFYGADGRDVQDAWMRERLEDPAYDMTIPIFHIGPFTCSTVHPEESLVVRTSWVHRLQTGRVPLVLSGHYHGYERAEDADITYVISAGGSEILYAQGPWLPETRAAQRVSHVVVLEIGYGQVSVEALDVSGNPIDAVTLP